MSMSRKAQDNIRRFAAEEAGKYLSNAEISYFERLGRKGGQAKDKIISKISKFRLTSKQTMEARDDLTLYMSDYVTDLVSQGYSEEEALEMAKTALKADSGSDQAADMQDKYVEYYLSSSHSDYEAVGMFYGGFLFLGLGVGGLIGFLSGGGREAFLSGGWVDALIGASVGIIIGIGLGEITHAAIALLKRNSKG